MSAIRIAACSELGARRYNEDALAHGHAHNGHYAVLCDGAGGHRRGAEAAQRAVACVERALRDESAIFSPAMLTQLVLRAHAELLAHQESDQADARMHCTIVVLWIESTGHHVLWSHVGDSRLYRFRHGHADVVTSDDSVVQRMVQSGLIRPEQTQDHPHKNQLLAALGMEPPPITDPAARVEIDLDGAPKTPALRARLTASGVVNGLAVEMLEVAARSEAVGRRPLEWDARARGLGMEASLEGRVEMGPVIEVALSPLTVPSA